MTRQQTTQPQVHTRFTSDRAIRWSAATVVAGVAGTAGWVSYDHALTVVRLAGETGAVAYAYPTFIDGLVYMSSMVLLSAARRQVRPPALAWWSLGAGIAVTLAANAYSMASHGVLGGLAGAPPAVALVLSYELLMWLIRASQVRTQPARTCSAGTCPCAVERSRPGSAALPRLDRTRGRCRPSGLSNRNCQPVRDALPKYRTESGR